MPDLEVALDEAIRSRNFEDIVWLIDCGANVNYTTSSGDSALLQAAGDGLSHVVQVLLAHGADPNSAGGLNGLTPLLKACGFGRTAVCKLLLNAGGNVYIQDAKGRAAIDWAHFSGNKETEKVIRDYVNALEDLRIEKSIARAEADVELEIVLRNNELCDAIHQNLASSRDVQALVALLDNPLFSVPCKGRWKQAMKYLKSLDKGDLNLVDSAKDCMSKRKWDTSHNTIHFTETSFSSWTPLILASYKGCLKLSKLLIWYGAQVNRESSLGHTALTWASYTGRLDIVKYLVDKARAAVRYKTKKESKNALIHACRGAKQDVVKYLVQTEWSRTLLAVDRNEQPPLDPFQAQSDWGEQCLAIDQPAVPLGSLNHTEDDEVHENIGPNIHINSTGFDEPREDLLRTGEDGRGDKGNSPSPNRKSNQGKSSRPNNSNQKKKDRLENNSKDSQLLLVSYTEYKAFLNHIDAQGGTAKAYAEEVNCAQSQRWLNAAHRRVTESIQAVVAAQLRDVPVRCKLGCGEMVRTDDVELHYKWSCPHRLVPCPVGCDARVRANEVTVHRDRQCPERKVRCGNVGAGCMVVLREGERLAHQAHKCMKRVVACRLGCGESIVFDKLIAHEMNRCRLRVSDCPLACGFAAHHQSLATHLRHACPLRTVQCDLGCGSKMPWRELAAHRETCEIPCRWAERGCGEKFSHQDRRTVHENHICGYRTVPCSLGCGLQGLQQRHQEGHELECEHRHVHCPLSCGKVIQAYEVHRHTVGEMGTCENRALPCRLEYEGRRIRAAREELEMLVRGETLTSLTDSLEGVCYSTVQRVIETALLNTLASGAEVKASDKDLIAKNAVDPRESENVGLKGGNASSSVRGHNPCAPDRRSLETPQPANDNRVFSTSEGPIDQGLLSDPVGGIATKTDQGIPAYQPGGNGTKEEPGLPSDQPECGQQEERETCLATIIHWHEKEQMHSIRYGRHIVFANLENFSFVELVDHESTLKCGLFPAHSRHSHEIQHCRLRNLKCQLGCNQLVKLCDMDSHLANHCPNRIVLCALGCGHRSSFGASLAHQEHECPNRQVRCECGIMVKSCKLVTHAKESCTMTQVRCPLGCGEYISRQQLEDHQHSECPKRVVCCPNACGQEMIWACELETHLSTHCQFRLLQCPDCKQELTFAALPLHRQRQCEKRQVSCPRRCSAPPMAADTLQVHLSETCEEIPRPCSLGCRTAVTDTSQDEHEAACPRRLAKCRYNCGEQVKHCNLANHEERWCSLRPVSCPSGCGESCPANAMDRHQQVCRRRVVPCGAGSKGCARMVQSWLAGDIMHARGRLFKCDAHGETVLGFAAAAGETAFVHHLLSLVAVGPALDHESNVGQTALTLAAEHGHVETVRALLQAGADPNRETRRSRTPLTCAVYGRYREVVELLLSHGARAALKPKNRLGALQVAQAMGDEEITYMVRNAVELEVNQRKLFIAISCGKLDDIRGLLKSGGRHFPRRLEMLSEDCEKARKHLKELKKELKDLENARIPAAEVVEKQQKIHVEKKKESDEIADQMNIIKDEYNRLNNKVLGPVLQSTKQTIKSIKRRDLQEAVSMSNPPRFFMSLVEVATMLLNLEEKSIGFGGSPKQRSSGVQQPQSEMNRKRLYKLGVAFLRNPKALNNLERAIQSSQATVQHLLLYRSTYRSNPSFKENFEFHIQEAERLDKLKESSLLDESSDSEMSDDSSSSGPQEDPIVTKVTRLLCQVVYSLDKKDEIAEQIKPLKLEEGKLSIKFNAKQIELTTASNILKSKQFNLHTITNTEKEAVQEFQFEQERLSRLEESILTAKLLLHVDSGGHNSLSWAAMYGDTRVVSLLLDKGACAGYDESLVYLAATIIQRAWWASRAVWEAHPPGPDALERRVRSMAKRSRLKESIADFRHERRRARCPLATALFNGHVECARLLVKRGAVENRSTLCMPSAPPPRPYPSMNNRDNLSLPPGSAPLQTAPDAVNAFRAAYFGKEFLASKVWKHGTGWDDRDYHDDAVDFAEQQEHRMHVRRVDKVRSKESHLSIARERQRQDQVHQELEAAIMEGDFESVFAALDAGANVDHMTRFGHTALSVAAMRASTMVDVDNNVVLVVDALMLRASSRPNVNRECGLRHTPLTLAARNGHVPVMDALFAHGADIHRTTSEGMNALMHAVKAGKHDATRYLLELGADVDCRNKEGLTAIQIAAKANFLDIMKSLSQRRHGNCGQARVSRGAVEVFTCSHGCGFKGTRIELQEHEPVCSRRLTDCPLGCGCEDLWLGEKEEHVRSACPHRQVTCPSGCDMRPQERNVESHLADECPKRMVPCPQCERSMMMEQVEVHLAEACPEREYKCGQCGDLILFRELANHLENECLMRKYRCTCGATMIAKNHPDHMARACPDRLVPCRWDCEGVEAKLKMRHELSECPLRLIPCPASCGKLVQAGSARDHVTTQCDMRFVSCTNKCGMKVLERKLGFHLAEECALRVVECQHGCGETHVAKMLDKHYKICRFYPVGCGNGCGETVQRYLLPEHKAKSCSERTVQCRAGCPKKMRAHQREHHENWECKKRPVYCRQGCDQVVRADKLNGHHRRECRMRFVECPLGCGHQLRHHVLEYHTEKECIRRQLDPTAKYKAAA